MTTPSNQTFLISTFASLSALLCCFVKATQLQRRLRSWLALFSLAAQRAAGMNRLCPTFLLALQKDIALFP
jgi:hypothetical protein